MNLISMLGSGMNSACVTWFLLQKTHSEMALGMLLTLQTILALMMLPSHESAVVLLLCPDSDRCILDY